MKYQHRFQVNAPLAEVADFHSRSASMEAITPPPDVVQLHQAPPRLGEGDEMDFTLWLGPLPIRWTARIEEVSPIGFLDCQQRGPFARWVHRHTFVSLHDSMTEVVDEIEFNFKKHPWWGLVGLGMAISLPLLFAYRGRKTRRLLETAGQQQ
jgi:ligand-binding SRPBCC domain-containing protein